MSAPIGTLRALVRAYPSAILGYSGGVDSALLAVVLRQELGRERFLAVIGRSASYPDAQWQVARDIAAAFDLPLREVATHELDDPRYLANPTNRCFFCKSELWAQLERVRAETEFAVVCDGTNADDLGEHRPGRAAGLAAQVRSPLAAARMTKAMVRDAARELHIPIWDAPAAPCLSSRVRYGLAITPRRLRQVEDAEAWLRSLGVRGDLRVRHLDATARVEVEPAWIPWMADRWPAVSEKLASLGFDAAELDPRGYRRGSLLPEQALDR